METRRPSEWTREARDTPVTRETLWYELDKMQHRVNTQFVLLGRRASASRSTRTTEANQACSTRR